MSVPHLCLRGDGDPVFRHPNVEYQLSLYLGTAGAGGLVPAGYEAPLGMGGAGGGLWTAVRTAVCAGVFVYRRLRLCGELVDFRHPL